MQWAPPAVSFPPSSFKVRFTKGAATASGHRVSDIMAQAMEAMEEADRIDGETYALAEAMMLGEAMDPDRTVTVLERCPLDFDFDASSSDEEGKGKKKGMFGVWGKKKGKKKGKTITTLKVARVEKHTIMTTITTLKVKRAENHTTTKAERVERARKENNITMIMNMK